MPFDEAYHFGFIRFFSHHLNPFVFNQPPDTYWLGALVHNPSFAYHYLMAFPEILLRHLPGGMETQVLGLRLINVGLAAANLFVIHKLARRAGVSEAISNVVVFIYGFTPVITVLSSQISYDNLFLLMTNLVALQTITVVNEFRKRLFNTPRLLWIAILGMFTSLIKFAFLPIFVMLAAVLIYYGFLSWREDLGGLRSSAKQSLSNYSRRLKGLTFLFLLLAGSFFIFVFSTNIIRYHSVSPDCTQVLTPEQCRQNINYLRFHQNLEAGSLVVFTGWWLIEAFLYLFGDIKPMVGLVNFNPLFVLLIVLVGALALCGTLKNFREIFKNRSIKVLGLLGAAYFIVLFLDILFGYINSGVGVYSGRYLAVVLPWTLIILALGAKLALRGKASLGLVRDVLTGLIILAFIIFGGAVPYLFNIAPGYGGLNQSDFSNELHP